MKWFKLEFDILVFDNKHSNRYKKDNKYWNLQVQKLIINICEGKYVFIKYKIDWKIKLENWCRYWVGKSWFKMNK
jgi:hypothetical protein